MSNVPDRATALRLDQADRLAGPRAEFRPPVRGVGSPAVYLCVHSLGLAPVRGAAIVNEELETWAQRGVDGHFEAQRPWVSYHEELSAGLAQLAGAAPSEVVAMNSLTVNI